MTASTRTETDGRGFSGRLTAVAPATRVTPENVLA
jgi:hypothetical protein